MIRFYNGRVLSFVNGTDITNDEVWTDGSRIVYVGAKKDEMPEFEREIDLKGDLLMPGFKNAHTHSPMTFCRSLADDMPLHRWLNEMIFPAEAKLNYDTVYLMTKIAIMEYLTSGVTASFDMYAHSDAYSQANIDCGFRTKICSALNKFDADPEDIERDFLKYNNVSELVSYSLGFHAEYTTSIERMEYMASLVQKHKSSMFVHASETSAEVEGCIERYGLTPIQLFEKLGMYDYGGGAYHCVWFRDEDIEIFRRRGLYAVTCPASNLKLSSGIAPIKRFMDEGINIAIGTDGPGSNNALDMFREMYLVTALQKYKENDAAVCDANEILKMACVGGAKAMELNDCDSIAVGKLADLTVLDLHKPNMRPLNNISKNIVYSGSKDNVRLTMINGRILYENGEFFIGEDPEYIYAQADKMVGAMMK